jgi:4-hydroxy-4-methyl-2-oxoglutarate aldolase
LTTGSETKSEHPGDGIAAQLIVAGVATVHEVLGRRGLVSDVRLLVGPAFAGRAATVAIPAGDNLGVHLAVERADAGSVLCVASAGAGLYGVAGEVLLEAARARSLAALVLDDGIRDIEVLSPPPSVAARTVCARGTVKRRVCSLGEPVGLGRTLIRPGDWIVGDADGVVAVPRELVSAVLIQARARRKKEAALLERVRAGSSTVVEFGLRVQAT